MIGWTDLPADLSDIARLNRLSLALPEAPVVSSDLRRAIATADALADGRGRRPHEPALRELHFGAWEGWTHAAAEAADPDRARALWQSPGTASPPGGESWDTLCARVWAAADRQMDGPDVVAVCHFGPILALLQRARGISPVAAFAQRIEPLSLTVIVRDAAGWRVERAGDVA
jgi:broad specificity phosphatase PhoE